MTLISVMIPCYNAAKTLPLALASLIAQTYENWECLVVDDGSTDHPGRLVQHLKDPRINYTRLDKNYGRGFARQIALEKARGDFLCMLDADDWYYPAKLQNQLLLMESNKDLALISSGMAIVDRTYNMVGVRNSKGNVGEFQRYPPMTFGFVPFPFAPSIIRKQIAQKYRFDLSLRRAEDADFLFQVLLEHPHGIYSEVNYVYTELDSVDIHNVLCSIKSLRLILEKYKKEFPLISRYLSYKLVLKSLAYQLLFQVGMHEKVILMRSQQATMQEKASFNLARTTIFQLRNRLFGDGFVLKGESYDG